MATGMMPPVGSLKAVDRSDDEKKKKIQSMKKHEAVEKETFGTKLRKSLIQEDLSSVLSYVIFEVVLQDLKDSFVNAVYDGLGMLLGVGKGRRKSKKGEPYDYSATSTSYSYGGRSNRRDDTVAMPSVSDYRDLGFDSKNDANEVLSNLQDLAEEYEKVSVADYIELCNRTPDSFTDNKIGWTFDMLKRVNMRRYGGMWYLDLPKPISID